MQVDTEIGTLADTKNFSASPRRRLAVSVLKWLSHLFRFGLAALFLFTAGAKLWILRDFVSKVAELLSSMGWNYHRWQWLVTIGVIGGEILIAALLIIPRTVRWGAAGAGLMLIGFSGFALYYVYGQIGRAH